MIRAIRAHWPQGEILVRADSHYACPEVLDWCEANGLDYVLALAPTSTLRRHVTSLEKSTAARFVEMKTRIKVHLPSSAPDQAVLRLALGRLPRLIL